MEEEQTMKQNRYEFYLDGELVAWHLANNLENAIEALCNWTGVPAFDSFKVVEEYY